MFGATDQTLQNVLANLPDELPVLPLRNMVAFPFTMLPITVGVALVDRMIYQITHLRLVTKLK